MCVFSYFLTNVYKLIQLKIKFLSHRNFSSMPCVEKHATPSTLYNQLYDFSHYILVWATIISHK